MSKKLFLDKFLKSNTGPGTPDISEKTAQSLDILLDPETDLYVETYFLKMLYLERKRAERFHHTFLLILFDLDELPETDKEKGVKIVSEALSTSMREVDVKGWYRHGESVGAIFTGAGLSEVEIIKEKYWGCVEKYGPLERALLSLVKMTFHVYPESEKGDGNGRVFDMALYPDISSSVSAKKNGLGLKRMIDIGGSLVAILIFSPFFVILPLLIKMTSEGPVFFKQKRVGRYGGGFTFLKFRTMAHNNDPRVHKEFIKKLIHESHATAATENGSKAVYKIKGDSRVTPIGKFLRKSSLDEIPQFFNVLMGQMSLVGPRPPIPYELEEYQVWHLRRVLEVKPGITGLWQVEGRSRTTFNEMVRLDLNYINNWSVLLDIKLIAQTPRSVLSTKGAF